MKNELQKHQDEMANELQKTLALFFKRDTFREIRILNTNNGTISGYYNDGDKLLKDIQQYDGRYNVFFTMNEPIEQIVNRSKNRLLKYCKQTTADNEIALRKWVLIDLDPVRRSGTSSTDEELSEAENLSVKIKEYLTSAGFPEPVMALSGNGYHLLYSVNLQNDLENTQLIKNFLGVLAQRFSTASVKVDTANYNAARITKMYGTMACKGEDSAERPHRRSRILSQPDGISNVSKSVIQAVIDDNSKENMKKESKSISNNTKIHKGSKNTFDLRKWLDKHNIMVARTKEVEDGMCYVLAECPWNHDHSRDKGAYIIQYGNGNIIAGCHHDSCRDRGVNWTSLWKLHEGNLPLPNTIENQKSDSEDNLKKSQADILLEIVEAEAHECYHNKDRSAFVQIIENEYPVNYPLDSEPYRQMLTGIFYKTTHRSIRKDAVQQVIDTLKAKAIFEGREYQTEKRFAMHNGELYYFLADVENTILCISKRGIELCKEPPIRLIKGDFMLEQPIPIKGKNFLDLLRKYYHLASNEDELLHDVILVARLISNIEQPIVIYTGPKGSYKTTSMDMDKRILDASSANVAMMSANEEDFLLLLASQSIICLDNIDRVDKQADVLCQVVTGSTFIRRQRFKDHELCKVNLKSSLYMTGINILSGRTDLLSRCIFLNTEQPVSRSRKSKNYLMEEFERDKPYIMYGLFTTLSDAMEIYDEIEEVKLESDDRLMDFIRWGYSIAEALGYGGGCFLNAYKKNRYGIAEESLADDEIANAVICYMDNHNDFYGSMTELGEELEQMLSGKKTNVSNKIKSPIQLSKRLKELETELSNIGIIVTIGKKSGKRFVCLYKKTIKD